MNRQSLSRTTVFPPAIAVCRISASAVVSAMIADAEMDRRRKSSVSLVIWMVHLLPSLPIRLSIPARIWRPVKFSVRSFMTTFFSMIGIVAYFFVEKLMFFVFETVCSDVDFNCGRCDNTYRFLNQQEDKAMRSSISGKLLALYIAMAGSHSFGETFYFKSGGTDFSVLGNYTMDEGGEIPATIKPGANDEVIVPSGTFLIDVSSDSFSTLSAVARVRPAKNAFLEFFADEGVTGIFNAPINWNGTEYAYNSESCLHNGTIVKKGRGTLVLSSCGKTKYNNYNQDYITGIDLREGTLKLPQYATGDMYFGDLIMSSGTILVTIGDLNNKSQARKTLLRSFYGDGIVTNETERASGQSFGPYARNEMIDNAFYGRICHPVKIWMYGKITQYGTETGLQMPITVEDNRGHLNKGSARGVYSFEHVALLGSAEFIQPFGKGGGYHYFGGVEGRIDKRVDLYTTEFPTFFDAGWYGGITFDGVWCVSGDEEPRAVQKWVVLTGSNIVPCVIKGDFKENSFSQKAFATDTPRTIFTQKLGSGTWRFSGTRNHGGGFAIDEGTLQFDSIAEKGIASALGNSTNLTTACSVRDPKHVDYAFTLGSVNPDAAPAVFEFTGEVSGGSRTRPLVLKGNGGSIKASGSNGARLDFGGISALDAGETTLVLDGTNTRFNVVSGISDGNGTVNVVKSGSGEWNLSGVNTFSGDLTIKEGVLNVLGSKYTWFRFTVKQTGNRGSLLWIRELALYDADGVRQNICLKVNAPEKIGDNLYRPDVDWCALEPGSFAFGMKDKTLVCSNIEKSYVSEIFDDVGNTASKGTPRFDGTTSYGGKLEVALRNSDGSVMNIRNETESSWVPFVMRLTNGTPEIVAYDIESFYNHNDTNKWPKIASMEASVDGVVWDLVETNALGEVLAEHEYDFSIPLNGNEDTSNRWYSDGAAQINWSPISGTIPRPGKGFPMRSRADTPAPLQNVRSVSVASGATLRAADTGIAINSLKINASGAGTIEGFAFAKSGALSVTFDGVPEHKSITLPGTYVSCTGINNIKDWTLDVDFGEATGSRQYNVNVVDDKIILNPMGLVISVR